MTSTIFAEDTNQCDVRHNRRFCAGEFCKDCNMYNIYNKILMKLVN